MDLRISLTELKRLDILQASVVQSAMKTYWVIQWQARRQHEPNRGTCLGWNFLFFFFFFAHVLSRFNSKQWQQQQQKGNYIKTHSTFWIPRKYYTTILEPAWYIVLSILSKVKQLTTLKLNAVSITIRLKEKVISGQHLIIVTNYDLIESAVLAIVRTTNSIVKLDSSASF